MPLLDQYSWLSHITPLPLMVRGAHYAEDSAIIEEPVLSYVEEKL